MPITSESDKELMRHFKRVINVKLNEAKITRFALAKMVGVRPAEIYTLLNNAEKSCMLGLGLRIMIALGITMDEVIAGKSFKPIIMPKKSLENMLSKRKRKKHKESIKEVSVGADGKPLAIKYYE